jgi:D-alanyl-lipoteichoic acid acyltransferase DltB (MBOAT superfamily)
LAVNLGLLFFFKYYNFFNSAVDEALGVVGGASPLSPLDVLLPVGISFYTFQTLSYTVDVYRGVAKPERSFGTFALFVAFFPQLVAGPIERSSSLLPQLAGSFPPPSAALLVSGLRLMAWGFFKKLVVADRLAQYVDRVYSSPDGQDGLAVVLATYFFAFQIYCDFSGYSDIAIGAARVLGVRLSDNFRAPYLARTVRDFWLRWHISLSSWFRDYVYIPLGGNRVGRWRALANIAIVFLLSGLWHGANWTFVAWGALHGFYVAVGMLVGPVGARLASRLSWRQDGLMGDRLRAVFEAVVTFHFVLFAWLFFRAGSLHDAMSLLGALGNIDPNGIREFAYFGGRDFLVAVFGIGVVLGVDALTQNSNLDRVLDRLRSSARWTIYYAVILCTIVWGEFGGTEFIYFQF